MKSLNFSKTSQILIISPHIDDAVLSCSSILLNKKLRKKIVIVNLFTDAHTGPYTFSAKQFLKASGNYDNAKKLFSDRVEEESQVSKQLGVKIINLGYTDASFRRKNTKSLISNLLPELSHVYPTYRWHVTKGKKQINDSIYPNIVTSLKKLKKTNQIILAPFAVGDHVDHVIAKKTCNVVFKNIIYYLDFPYTLRTNEFKEELDKYQIVEQKIDLSKKTKLMKLYKSQFDGLFSGSSIPKHKEYFLTNK